ncbi:hypothetical protein RQN30_10715 [Arcanobacterium hippocoleae]
MVNHVSGDFTVRAGDVRLQVRGLTRTLQAMDKAGADAQEMRKLMHELGMIVVRKAKAIAPRGENRKLLKTIRAGRGKTKAVVRAGSRAVPYAGITHYGTPPGYHRPANRRPLPIKANEYLVKALQSTQDEVYTKLIQGISDILDKNGL